METIIDNRLVELIQKCEIMVQLTNKACSYWNVIRYIFQSSWPKVGQIL